MINGEYRFTLSQVSNFFEIDIRTVRRYLKQYGDELSQNGYEVFTGKRLTEAKKVLATDKNVLTKITQLGLFNFRSFLNLAMLLTGSESAKVVRAVILNIAIDVISRRAGGELLRTYMTKSTKSITTSCNS